MLNSRSTHYWLWFVLFGLVAGFANGFNNTETVVVGIAGLLGILTGLGRGTSRFGRSYDLIVGLLFTLLGFIGILASLGIANKLGISASKDGVLGLSLAVPYNLIHTVLGLTSLNQSFKPTPIPTTVEVATQNSAAAAQ